MDSGASCPLVTTKQLTPLPTCSKPPARVLGSLAGCWSGKSLPVVWRHSLLPCPFRASSCCGSQPLKASRSSQALLLRPKDTLFVVSSACTTTQCPPPHTARPSPNKAAPKCQCDARYALDAPVGSNTSTVSSCCPSRSTLTCSVMSTLNLSYLRQSGNKVVLSWSPRLCCSTSVGRQTTMPWEERAKPTCSC